MAMSSSSCSADESVLGACGASAPFVASTSIATAAIAREQMDAGGLLCSKRGTGGVERVVLDESQQAGRDPRSAFEREV